MWMVVQTPHRRKRFIVFWMMWVIRICLVCFQFWSSHVSVVCLSSRTLHFFFLILPVSPHFTLTSNSGFPSITIFISSRRAGIFTRGCVDSSVPVCFWKSWPQSKRKRNALWFKLWDIQKLIIFQALPLKWHHLTAILHALNSSKLWIQRTVETQGHARTTNLLKSINQINMPEFLFSLDTRRVFNV